VRERQCARPGCESWFEVTREGRVTCNNTCAKVLRRARIVGGIPE
jgi:hypothetical protein